MKKIIIGLFAIISIVGLLSCENANNSLDPMNSDFDNSLARRNGGGSNPPCPAEGTAIGFYVSASSEYAIYEYTLWADKDLDAGTATITNDDENIYVTYNTIETMFLDEAHVFLWSSIDDVPNKRPKNKRADYEAEDINDTTFTFAIPMDAVCGDAYFITAEASLFFVQGDDEDEDDEEDDGNGDDEDDDDDDHGNGHDSHGNGHGHGHDSHGNGNGYGHDENDGPVKAYAGDATSPQCFNDSGRKWWSFVSYPVDCFSMISGHVYDDADNSGSLDASETGFGGMTITASGSDGNWYTSITDVDGAYLLEHLTTGVDYTIIVTEPAGDYVAGENAGGYILANLMGEESPVNFGFYLAVTLSECATSDTLYADAGVDAGTVVIANDDDNLYITFDTNEMADLFEIHIDITGDSSRAVNNPDSYNANASVVLTDLPADAITVTIPFASTSFTCSDIFVVKAHAVLTVDATSGTNTLDGAGAFGGDNYATSRAGGYGDIEYSSCCVVTTPR